MATCPAPIVEIGFGSGFGTPIASISWTDVSAYVEAAFPVTRGRPDELSEVQPATLSVTLKNDDGRFTPAYTSGAYYPNVLRGVPIRVRATWSATNFPRFFGYVDAWDLEWPEPATTRNVVQVSASSRQSRMGRTAALRSILENEILVDGPTSYYTLSDPEGSLTAANSARTAQPALAVYGSGPVPVFGNAIGPGTDGLTAAEFASGANLRQSADLSPVLGTGSGRVYELWFSTTSVLTQVLFVASGASGGARVTTSGGTLSTLYQGAGGAPVGTSTPGSVADGLTHHVMVRESYSSPNYTVDLFLDGVLVSTNTAATGAFTSLNKVSVGVDFTGALAHVATYDATLSDARILAHYESGTTVFAGDSSDEWVERLAGYAGVPAVEIVAEAGHTTSMGFVDTAAVAPAEAMQTVVRTEQGMLFDGKDGTLVFHSRGHRYGATSVLSLDHSLQRRMNLQPKLDDLGMVNDITVSLADGYAVRVVNQASVTANGLYQQSVDLLTTSQYEADDFANWTVNLYGDPKVRVPNVTVELVGNTSTAMTTSLLNLELGDKITFTNLPSQAPTSSMSFFVEGYTEVIGYQTHKLTLNLSPTAVFDDVWILGVSELGDAVLGY